MLKQLLILSVLSFSVFSQAEVSLHKMMKNGASAQEIRLAIEQGADVNERVRWGLTPLMVISNYYRGDNTRMIEVLNVLLQQGADVNARKRNGETVLVDAALGHPRVMIALLQAGADVHARNKKGETALIIASRFGYLDNAKLLLQYGADVNAKDEDGVTALMHASDIAKLEFVKVFLYYGADVNARDKDGRTALSYLRDKGYYLNRKPKGNYNKTFLALKQAGATE